MEPLGSLREGYYVELSNKPGKVYKVTGAEALEYETGTEVDTIFSSVSSGGDSTFKPIKPLEPDKDPMHFYEVLWGVKDGCRYYLQMIAGTDRLGIDEARSVGYVDNEKSPYHSPNPQYKFWCIHDFYPAIKAENDTGGSVTPKIWFKGTKYEIKEVSGPELSLAKEKAKPITMGGIKTS